MFLGCFTAAVAIVAMVVVVVMVMVVVVVVMVMVAGSFNRMKKLKANVRRLAELLEKSATILLSDNKKAVRRVAALPTSLVRDRCTVWLYALPDGTDEGAIRERLARCVVLLLLFFVLFFCFLFRLRVIVVLFCCFVVSLFCF